MAAGEAGESASERIVRWVREHSRAVRGYLLGLVRQPEVADDLLQQVFQRAWQAQDRYRDEGRERAYLLRIADRLVCDRGRRIAGRELTVAEETWHEVEPFSREPGPADALQRLELGEEVNAALDRLSPAQRRVLLLRFFGDLTFEEIAETLECPLGTALSHCRRGLMALKKLLPAPTET
jgi:RNA polymerase sigma-70 factor (ECF subfamily)